jgi:ribosomal protein S17
MSETQTRNRRKLQTGEVITVTGKKSLKVATYYKVKHPLYKKRSEA